MVDQHTHELAKDDHFYIPLLGIHGKHDGRCLTPVGGKCRGHSLGPARTDSLEGHVECSSRQFVIDTPTSPRLLEKQKAGLNNPTREL